MKKFAILAVVSAGGLVAQPQPRPPIATQYWWESRVAMNSLNLTEAQTKQLNSIQAANVNRLMDLRSAVTKAENNLQEVFNQPNADELKADAAVDQYANARDNLTRALTRLSLQMRSVLTDEQWQELAARQAGRPSRGPGPGRGRRGGSPASAGSGAGTANKVAPPAASQATPQK